MDGNGASYGEGGLEIAARLSRSLLPLHSSVLPKIREPAPKVGTEVGGFGALRDASSKVAERASSQSLTKSVS
jgi:hypothetical protein